MRNLIEFEYSPWLIIVCLIVGASYGYIQYTKQSPWSSQVNIWLAISRSILVSLIAVLLLGPLVRTVKNYFEKPLLVIAIDSSESIALITDSLNREALLLDLKEVKQEMINNGWQVSVVDLTGEVADLDSVSFDAPRTNLTKMLRDQLNENFGSNLGAVLTISDGIFNSGFSPDLITPFTPIYSLGLGDTIPKMDLSIIDIEYNKTVYQDNRYPVLIKIRNEGINDASTNLKVYLSGNLVDQEDLLFDQTKRIVEHEFLLNAEESGKQRITIVLDSIPGEATAINNRAQIFVDVIDGKQRILLVSEGPSPDMKAFRLAIEKNNRFDIEQTIGELPESMNYDLMVVFSSPTRTSRSILPLLSDNEIPKLFFIGTSTDLRPYIQNGVLSINRLGGQYDLVRASYNLDLMAFNIINDMNDWLANVPPMTVPFGEFNMPPNSQVILSQQVGSVVTAKPLIYVTNDNPKTGVIIGDGFWRWRLDEYRNYGETVRFDELVSKTTQFLAAKPDNRQFKLYPIKNGFEVGEDLIFIAETYNQLFEPAYGEPISLNVFNDTGNWNYSFTPLSGSNKFSIDDLVEGLYSYNGTTLIDGKSHSVSGQFSVERSNVEAADLTADHVVLRKLSQESGGNYYSVDQIDELKKEMASIETTSVIHSQEREIFLFNLSWVLILLLLLASAEWLTRKMMGSY